MSFWKNLFVGTSSFFLVVVSEASEQVTPPLISSSYADTWVATDDLGRSLPVLGEARKSRNDKFVGIFYFIWQGAHGYDRVTAPLKDEGVHPVSSSDTESPYDVSKILASNPSNPVFGPERAFHYWAEPYFGYYLPNDEWVIRKHSQMLSDAGVDVIIFDATNARIYLPQARKIASVFRRLRSEGRSTPSIAFLINSKSSDTVRRLYDEFYAPGEYSDIWFYWKGKPLLLAPSQGLGEEIKQFFTLRQSWAWTRKEGWFGNGKDKWAWLDHTPQNFGWHESPNKPEQISVAAAQHPTTNIGRSHKGGVQPEEDDHQPERGIYFAEQWERALEIDPEFIFITGWNEWVAMRFTDDRISKFVGKQRKQGDTFFVDQYNLEYSRDIEPMKGGFGDNYYFQMVDGIRKFKGVRPIPTANEYYDIEIDGNFDDWKAVSPQFHDDAGDTFHRQHQGWGNVGVYENRSGRNDLVNARVAVDKNSIYFYVSTAGDLEGLKGEDWMNLLISLEGHDLPEWEGFQFIVNRGQAGVSDAILERSHGDWSWEPVVPVRQAVGKREIELAIPRRALGLEGKSFTMDFKWVDNAGFSGNPMRFWSHGDSAPNGRFSYRLIFTSP